MSDKKRRSKLELTFEEILKEGKAEYDYEVTKINYIVPESKHVYTVDWTLPKNILLETKGYLSDAQERNKYVLIKQQFPDIDLRFIFANNKKLCGGMKTTHEAWAIKHGFKYCSIKDTDVIQSWIEESK
jgi:hypothetical protein